jgi:non-ribosomal peptide synthetase component E (peptide arylation enzyme)
MCGRYRTSFQRFPAESAHLYRRRHTGSHEVKNVLTVDAAEWPEEIDLGCAKAARQKRGSWKEVNLCQMHKSV